MSDCDISSSFLQINDQSSFMLQRCEVSVKYTKIVGLSWMVYTIIPLLIFFVTLSLLTNGIVIRVIVLDDHTKINQGGSSSVVWYSDWHAMWHSVPLLQSSGDEDDDWRHKRRENNRVAAQKSRNRQTQRADELHEVGLYVRNRLLIVTQLSWHSLTFSLIWQE